MRSSTTAHPSMCVWSAKARFRSHASSSPSKADRRFAIKSWALSRSKSSTSCPQRTGRSSTDIAAIARNVASQAQLYLSRGCPFDCAFCMERAKRDVRWRAYSVERAVEEVVRLHAWLDLRGLDALRGRCALRHEDLVAQGLSRRARATTPPRRQNLAADSHRPRGETKTSRSFTKRTAHLALGSNQETRRSSRSFAKRAAWIRTSIA